MSRVLLTLSGFGFGGAAGVAAEVLPMPVATGAVAALLLCFFTLQHIRDDEVASAARTQALGGGR